MAKDKLYEAAMSVVVERRRARLGDILKDKDSRGRISQLMDILERDFTEDDISLIMLKAEQIEESDWNPRHG